MKNLFTLLVDFGTPAYDETLRLRDDILRKPLGLDYQEEQLSKEYTDFHLACYNENFDLLGCMVLTPKEKGNIKMRQVAVKENIQGKGIGTKMVEDCEKICLEKGFQKIVLNARDTAIPFYTRLNYDIVGEQFTEVSIPHHKMEKCLTK